VQIDVIKQLIEKGLTGSEVILDGWDTLSDDSGEWPVLRKVHAATAPDGI